MKSKLPAFNELFKTLRKENFLAKQNFSCCNSCAGYELTEIAFEKYNQNKPYKGFVFYHNQNTEDMKRTGFCYLSYGHITHYDENSIPTTISTIDNIEDVGKRVVEICKELGLYFEWDGNPGSKIKIKATT